MFFSCFQGVSVTEKHQREGEGRGEEERAQQRVRSKHPTGPPSRQRRCAHPCARARRAGGGRGLLRAPAPASIWAGFVSRHRGGRTAGRMEDPFYPRDPQHRLYMSPGEGTCRVEELACILRDRCWGSGVGRCVRDRTRVWGGLAH